MPKPREIAPSTDSITTNQETRKVLAARINAFLDAAKYSLEFVPNQENGRVTIPSIGQCRQGDTADTTRRNRPTFPQYRFWYRYSNQ